MRASLTMAMATSPCAVPGATRDSQRPSPPSLTARPRPSVTLTDTPRRRGLLLGSTTVGVVRLHDLLHQRMPNDGLLVEADERDAFDVADHFHGLDEARRAAGGQIDLRDVSGNDGLRSEPEAGEEHLH